jgi:hypothetical protein
MAIGTSTKLGVISGTNFVAAKLGGPRFSRLDELEERVQAGTRVGAVHNIKNLYAL